MLHAEARQSKSQEQEAGRADSGFWGAPRTQLSILQKADSVSAKVLAASQLT